MNAKYMMVVDPSFCQKSSTFKPSAERTCLQLQGSSPKSKRGLKGAYYWKYVQVTKMCGDILMIICFGFRSSFGAVRNCKMKSRPKSSRLSAGCMWFVTL